MAKTYHCSLEVRGYELDSFGHVNHAVYVSYLEHARWQFLKDEGITLESFNQWKRWPVIAQIELTYLKPTFLGDILDVRSSIPETSRSSFIVEQTIHRGEELVVKGKVKIVTVNEKGRPAETPAEVTKIWS